MDLNRRVFIKGAVATSVLSALPVKWVFADKLPAGVSALDISALTWTKAEDLPSYFKVLNTNPLNAYPPEHMLAPAVTPADVSFIRWNGIVPDFKTLDAKTWTFTVDGESVITPKTYTIDALKRRLYRLLNNDQKPIKSRLDKIWPE